MKRINKTLSLLTSFLMIFSINSWAVRPLEGTEETASIKDQVTVDDLLNKSLGEIEAQLGKELKFKERFVLRAIKRKIKKAKKAGKSMEELEITLRKDQSAFDIGAFLLGMLLMVVGVGLAYLLLGRDKARASWLGAACFIVFFGLALYGIVQALGSINISFSVW